MEYTFDYCKLVFSLANEIYKGYKHNGDWDKALCPDVDNTSAMVNDPAHPSGNNRCWNCGKLDCNVMKCPKPKDAARIAANRKLFYYQKQKDRETAKAAKDTPRPLNLSHLLGVFQNHMRTTSESSMDVPTPITLQNLVGMKMKPLLFI